jgi:hypothetical protein
MKQFIIVILLLFTCTPSLLAIPEEIDACLAAIAKCRKAKNIEGEQAELQKLGLAIRRENMSKSQIYKYYKTFYHFMEVDIYSRMRNWEKTKEAFYTVSNHVKDLPMSNTFKQIVEGNTNLRYSEIFYTENPYDLEVEERLYMMGKDSYLRLKMTACIYWRYAATNYDIDLSTADLTQVRKFAELAGITFFEKDLKTQFAGLEKEIAGYGKEEIDLIYASLGSIDLSSLDEYDFQELFALLHELSQCGQADAWWFLGMFFESDLYGFPNKPDTLEAFKCYKNATELGSSQGAYALARCYAEGKNTAPDHKRAFELLSEREEAPDFRAYGAYYMGLIYERGIAVPADTLRAMEYYMIATDEGWRNAVKEEAYRAQKNLYDKYYKKE